MLSNAVAQVSWLCFGIKQFTDNVGNLYVSILEEATASIFGKTVHVFQ